MTMLMRRGMLGSSGGAGAEYITLPDNTLTNTTQVDTYFSQIVDGWSTEPILLMIDEPCTTNNEFIGCFSSYLQNTSYFGGFTVVYRYGLSSNKYTNVTRSDYPLTTTTGKRYKVLRFKDCRAE